MTQTSAPWPGSTSAVAEALERRQGLARVLPTLASRVSARAWLATILVVAAALRFVGLDWDQGQHLHPDERFLTMVSTALQWPDKDFLATYFNEATSTLNPRNVGHSFFVYGDLPVILIKRIALTLSLTGYEQVYLVGRAVDGLVDLGTVTVVFLLGRRLYRDERVALLGAALYALSALAIQQAHFYVVDNFSVFFVTVALYFLARTFQIGRMLDYALAGAFGGLALASKISVYPILGMVVIVAVARVASAWNDPTVRRATLIEQTLFRLTLSGAAAFIAFRICQPYAFQTPSLTTLGFAQRWIDNALEARSWVSGERDAPFAHQWANRTPLVFPLTNMLLWGMGLPLGLTAWAGWGVAGWQLVRRARWVHLVPVVWTALLFGILGTQWVKSMRYFLPIYPTLALLAGWLLVQLWDRGRARWVLELPRNWGALWWTPRPAGVLLGLVVVGTLLYALAFAGIYTRPHTRVEASRWIYANIPPGTAVANETKWDDGLPLRVDDKNGFAAGMYLGLNLNITDDESPKKLEQMLAVLDQTEYLFISSNRQYDALTRIPIRFPLAVRYYQALFSGELGFERVVEFTSYPRLGFLQIPDQGAEEAWTVYDHPRVQVFGKTAAYSRANAERTLGGINFDAIVRLNAKQATDARNALLLTPEERQASVAGGTWSDVFDPNSLANRLPVAVWALAVAALGLVAVPYLWLVARPLPDCGYAIARPLGLLLVGWVVWWLASLKLTEFSRQAVVLSLLLVTAGALAIVLPRRSEFLAWVRRSRRLLLIEEGLFWAFFTVLLAVRSLNPDLWHPTLGGEKPMDFAYLNAVVKSTYFPPYDPWFAGGYINYYYFGFVLVATLIHLTGVVPAVAYNLAIATWFAFLAMAAFGVVLGLLSGGVAVPHLTMRPVVGAFLGSLFVAVIGNLGEATLILEALQAQSTLTFQSAVPGLEPLVKSLHGFFTGVLAGRPLAVRLEWWYWNPTRVIDHLPTETGPITELPWFTFLYGDLHAHLLALPFTVVVLALVVALIREAPAVKSAGIGLGRLLLLSLVVGSLWPMNTWDLATYALVSVVGFGFHAWRQAGHVSIGLLIGAALRGMALVVLGYLAFLPFHQHYGSAVSGIAPWSGSRTPFHDYLTLNGFFLFVISSALLADLWFSRDLNPAARLLRIGMRNWRRPARVLRLHVRLVRPSPLYAAGRWLLGFVAIVTVGLWVVGLSAQALAAMLMTLTAMLVVRRQDGARPGQRTVLWQFALLLIFLGLALTFVVEFVVLKNVDIGRMNTVFKFYLQAWVLWGVAAAVALARVVDRLPRFSPSWRSAWRYAFAALFAATLLYPVLATRARVADRFDTSVGPTLDGMAFMDRAVYNDRDRPLRLAFDAEAIRWVQANLRGSPVFGEANTAPTLYGWGNRFAMFTGNPAVVGWDWHQRQQRGVVSGELVTRRVQEIQQAYASPDPALAARTFARYGVQYFVVGELERAYFPGGEEKWAAERGHLWDLVYENPGVQIYQVR